MRRLWLLFLGIMLVLPSCTCTPSVEVIQTAIAQTMAATQAMATANAEALPTSTPSLTPSPLPSETPMPSPTPDGRVFTDDPQTYLCTKSDLTEKGGWVIPKNGLNRTIPYEAANQFGVNRGALYLEETKFQDGWTVRYNRTEKFVILPNTIWCTVYAYETSAGAQRALTDYYDYQRLTRFSDIQYVEIEADTGLGEDNRTFINQIVDVGGQVNTYYITEFTERNLLIVVQGFAYKDTDLPLEFLIDIGRKMSERLFQILPSRKQVSTLPADSSSDGTTPTLKPLNEAGIQHLGYHFTYQIDEWKVIDTTELDRDGKPVYSAASFGDLCKLGDETVGCKVFTHINLPNCSASMVAPRSGERPETPLVVSETTLGNFTWKVLTFPKSVEYDDFEGNLFATVIYPNYDPGKGKCIAAFENVLKTISTGAEMTPHPTSTSTLAFTLSPTSHNP